MPTDEIFVLDANVFIEAKKRYYAFDLAPKFWDSLIAHANDGRVLSIDRVLAELDRGKDELTKWANGGFKAAFAPTDDKDVVDTYRKTMNWVNGQNQFTEAAKAEFAAGADGWLVACSKVHGYVLVTDEVLNPNIKRRVPIPNVCTAFNVPWINTFEMLRRLGVKFA